MYDFKINQEVWFLLTPCWCTTDEIPKWTHGKILKRYKMTIAYEKHTFYDIKPDDAEKPVQVDEFWVFDTLDDLQEEVEICIVSDEVDMDMKIDRLQKELKKAKADLAKIRKWLRVWKEKCKEASPIQ